MIILRAIICERRECDFSRSASDLLKLGMLKVSERFKNNPSVRLLLQVHDELIFEIEEKTP